MQHIVLTLEEPGHDWLIESYDEDGPGEPRHGDHSWTPSGAAAEVVQLMAEMEAWAHSRQLAELRRRLALEETLPEIAGDLGGGFEEAPERETWASQHQD